MITHTPRSLSSRQRYPSGVAAMPHAAPPELQPNKLSCAAAMSQAAPPGLRHLQLTASQRLLDTGASKR